MDASLRQLAAYAAVAKAASFTAAAEELHVSQPPLSRTVADLERSFGEQLLERDTRNGTLTPADETLRVAEEIINTQSWDARAAAILARRNWHGLGGDTAVSCRSHPPPGY
ncbi:helix-turn-helix domain-containing protein [Brevibacterium sp. FAM 24638]|uniref:helix-turn-helix domain-containing protein n=1 Tax=Brevibacterium sp. FAM 24638 TaxID=3415681 RepID=UPI003C799EF8